MRLAGQAKLGFYPTPVSVVADIIRILDISPKAKVFDPCCGEGEALQLIKNEFSDILTYGVELDTNRYELASKRLDYCLNCDAISELKVTNDCFDVLWENPPYDYDVKSETAKTMRTEKKFLQRHAKYLNTAGGVLVYIIPFHVLNHVKGDLIKYADLKVLSFPQGEYVVFKQVVVLGRAIKKITSSMLSLNKAYLEKIIAETPADAAYNYLETTQETDLIYTVTPCNIGVETFYTSRINPEVALDIIAQSSLTKDFISFTQTKNITSIRPMAELTEGHLAMLIAAGMMDGLLEAKGEKIVVKGFVERFFNERDEFTEERKKHIRMTKYSITINAINLTKKEFVRIAA